MKETLVRSLTGAAYVALTLAAIWSGPFTMTLLFLPACAVGAWEFHRLYWSLDKGPPVAWTVASSTIFYLGVAILSFSFSGSVLFPFSLCAVILLISAWLMLLRGAESPSHDLGGSVLSLLYVALPFALLPHMLGIGEQFVLGAFVLLWVNDSGAYLIGKLIGKHKLIPRVSPGKTVEGLIGGVLATLLTAWLIQTQFGGMSLWKWLSAAMIISVVGTIGDLVQSAMKRERGLKDSGEILPGHGGILDRFDGLLLAMPAFLLFIRYFA